MAAEGGGTATADLQAWVECARCPDLEGCFRLSTGTFLQRAFDLGKGFAEPSGAGAVAA